MKIRDLLALAIDKKISYGEAKQKLKEMRLPEDEEESYDVMLHKLLGKDESVFHEPIYQLNGIPNELYYPILADTISMVRAGLYSPDICQNLYDNYNLIPALINYFINEAISIVRMNTLKPEEIAAIGQAYHKVAVALGQTGSNEEPAIEGLEEINAVQVSEVVNSDDFFEDDD